MFELLTVVLLSCILSSEDYILCCMTLTLETLKLFVIFEPLSLIKLQDMVSAENNATAHSKFSRSQGRECKQTFVSVSLVSSKFPAKIYGSRIRQFSSNVVCGTHWNVTEVLELQVAEVLGHLVGLHVVEDQRHLPLLHRGWGRLVYVPMGAPGKEVKVGQQQAHWVAGIFIY